MTTALAELIYETYGPYFYKKTWFDKPTFKALVVSELEIQLPWIVSHYLKNRDLFLTKHSDADDVNCDLESRIFNGMDGTGPHYEPGDECLDYELNPPLHTLLEQQLELCRRISLLQLKEQIDEPDN